MFTSRRMAVLVVGVLLLSLALPATAAPQPPTGDLTFAGAALERSVAATPILAYGDQVEFASTIDGRISKQARIYVTLVCFGTDSDAAFQWSKWNDTGVYTFDLVDQDGQGLDWFSGQDAYCDASLIHRVQKGKAAEITVLDSLEFFVSG